MESFITPFLFAIPFFIVLVLFEIGYSHIVKKQVHSTMDTVSSISSGLTHIVKESMGLLIIIISYPYLLENFALFEIPSSFILYGVAFVALDFASYLYHLLNHRINVLWNQHVIHHSSEEFNLACAIRRPVSNIIAFFPLLLVPAAIFGVPHEVISALFPIHVFAQFWYHTKHIGKLGILEYIIVTPSQHRVHHAINEEYIDKNLGAIFCVWDRLFGTFQEELDDVPAVYGILKPAHTWNPFLINFQHIWCLIQDAWHTENAWDKLRIWFMPTGWRPTDVIEKYPINKINDVKNFKKYTTNCSRGLKIWSVYQLTATLFLTFFMFYNYGILGFDNLLLYGIIIFVGIYGYTTLMDRKKYAVIIEVMRGVLGLTLIICMGDWFGLNNYISWGGQIVVLYFVSTIIGSFYFTFFEKNLSPSNQIMI
ncbi:sterol desaturase family protein [Tamlana flava]|uniref:sterol desaturase family protein n=1 Tax=Tamlana flava TaxID=3158572 RepID=UPI00351B3B3C